jgi:multiple sugar transport system substrate-binding protein
VDRHNPQRPHRAGAPFASARTRRRFLQQAGAALAAPAVAGLTPRLAGTAPRAQQTVELQYWTPVAATQPDYAGFQALIAEFEKANPTIKVNQQVVAFEQLENRVTVAAQGGNLPDVVWCLPETVPTYQRMGILADLTSQWNAWPDRR